MANFFTLRGRTIPRSDVALVELFEHETRSIFRPRTTMHGRVILLNRDSVLIEEHPIVFSRENDFLWLSADQVGLNPTITFLVQEFCYREGFVPAKAYASRITWFDGHGNEQSKLLLAATETVRAIIGQVSNA